MKGSCTMFAIDWYVRHHLFYFDSRITSCRPWKSPSKLAKPATFLIQSGLSDNL